MADTIKSRLRPRPAKKEPEPPAAKPAPKKKAAAKKKEPAGKANGKATAKAKAKATTGGRKKAAPKGKKAKETAYADEDEDDQESDPNTPPPPAAAPTRPQNGVLIQQGQRQGYRPESSNLSSTHSSPRGSRNQRSDTNSASNEPEADQPRTPERASPRPARGNPSPRGSQPRTPSPPAPEDSVGSPERRLRDGTFSLSPSVMARTVVRVITGNFPNLRYRDPAEEAELERLEQQEGTHPWDRPVPSVERDEEEGEEEEDEEEDEEEGEEEEEGGDEESDEGEAQSEDDDYVAFPPRRIRPWHVVHRRLIIYTLLFLLFIMFIWPGRESLAWWWDDFWWWVEDWRRGYRSADLRFLRGTPYPHHRPLHRNFRSTGPKWHKSPFE